MNIKYKLNKFDNGILTSSNETDWDTFIPKSDENPLFQEYLQWLAEGNTPEPADDDEPEITE